jgi:hypothetical protein
MSALGLALSSLTHLYLHTTNVHTRVGLFELEIWFNGGPFAYLALQGTGFDPQHHKKGERSWLDEPSHGQRDSSFQDNHTEDILLPLSSWNKGLVRI